MVTSNQLAYRVEPRDDDRAFLVLKCEHRSDGECRFGLWQRPASGITWQWDGNVERPTITPSIDCKGGCGRHFIMTNGRVSQ